MREVVKWSLVAELQLPGSCKSLLWDHIEPGRCLILVITECGSQPSPLAFLILFSISVPPYRGKFNVFLLKLSRDEFWKIRGHTPHARLVGVCPVGVRLLHQSNYRSNIFYILLFTPSCCP